MVGYGIPPLANRGAWNVVGCFMGDEWITFENEPDGVEETRKGWKGSYPRGARFPLQSFWNRWKLIWAVHEAAYEGTDD